MSYLMMWSLMMSHLSSWGQLPKLIGDKWFYFVTLVDMFCFNNNIFPSTITDVHINLSQVLKPKNYL